VPWDDRDLGVADGRARGWRGPVVSADFRELALLLALVALVVVPAAVLRVRRLRAPLRRLRAAEGMQPRRLDPAMVRARLATVDPRRLMAGGTVVVGGIGLLAGGPVAAVVGVVYAGLVVRALSRAMARRAVLVARTSSLDELCSLAGDLRAGLPPSARRGADLADRRLAELTAAVWRLAEHTGAPAADLVERIEDDARAADRATASAKAQAAGAQMTALLLAALPLAGIGLGYSIGADPLQVLLGTKVGAGCALIAVTLQAGGLLWCDRLMAGVTR
jgi:tight adherence protein B